MFKPFCYKKYYVYTSLEEKPYDDPYEIERNTNWTLQMLEYGIFKQARKVYNEMKYTNFKHNKGVPEDRRRYTYLTIFEFNMITKEYTVEQWEGY